MRFVAGIAFFLALQSAAFGSDVSFRPGLDLSQKLAVGLEDDAADQALLILQPKARVRLPDRWTAEIKLRFEAAGGQTGLGSRDTYSDLSRPLKLGSNARAEIDEAALSWRRGGTRLKFGKQTFAWGVLDGLQVTDRLDPVRRREAVFVEPRPDRIARWGARAEFEEFGVRWDAAAIVDGTGDQLARPRDTFAATAPRFRGGLTTGAALPDLRVKIPNTPTLGVRGRKVFGQSDAGLLVVHGPDVEPIIDTAATTVSLAYKTRTLVGGTWQTSAGSTVLRTEFAWVPDQPVNVSGPTLGVDRRQRALAGVGVDWDLPNGLFFNGQLAADWIEGDDLIRPNTDTVLTLRLQKSWANETWRTSAEILNSMGDGDGAFRPGVAWQVNDKVAVEAGLDVIWGASDGLIGQFKDRGRAWVRLSASV